jgi:hypothetical protein
LKHRLKAKDKDDAYCSTSVCSSGEGVRRLCAEFSVLMRDKDESTSTILVIPLLPLVQNEAVKVFIASRDVRMKKAFLRHLSKQ